MEPRDVALVVVGSIGLDTIETTAERRESVLGGSVSYACAAASFFVPVGMVGVVGEDFPDEHVAFYQTLRIDVRGLQRAAGKTFRWSGAYGQDPNLRRTLSTELNVFAGFSPRLPEAYRRCPFLFLANIGPELQLHVLDQAARPRFVAADTMDLWIATAREPLRELIRRVDLLTLNDSEARQLTGETGLIRAARQVLRMGPRYVVLKKGEHGAMLFWRDGVFVVPAYPVEDVRDPTGAGDLFAGGLMGAMAAGAAVDEAAVRRAMIHGAVLASFGVEAFGLERLATLSRGDIAARLDRFRRLTAFPV